MHHPFLVGILQTHRRLADIAARLGDRQRPMLGELVAQRQPLNILHRQEMHAARFLGIMCGHDVRMA